MLITDNIIFIELHKTGSSHTRRVLLDLFGDNCKIFGKHASIENIPYEIQGNLDNKIKLGNIRNPWDWYVSLWAFGCQNKGGIYNYLTSPYKVKTLSKKGIKKMVKERLNLELPKLDKKKWDLLYSDPNNVENFNSWLKLILDIRNHDIGEGFKSSNISEFAGLLTYRYFNLFTANKNFKKLKSYKELQTFDLNENIMDIMIRNEVLHKNLLEIADRLGVTAQKMTQTLEKYKNKTNKSIRKKDYRYYYSDDAYLLVKKYEKFIINKYNYSF